MNLSWTEERPSIPGWYWWKGENDHEGEIIELFLHNREGKEELRAWMTRDEQSYPFDAIKGKFSGPISLPSS